MHALSPFHCLAPALLLATSASVALPASADCRKINGHYTEQVATGGCTSPVGVCLQGTYSGVLQGSFATVVVGSPGTELEFAL